MKYVDIHKKTISIFTSTRAEYHLLHNLIKKINEAEDFELDLIVSGTHLSEKYGHTIDDIISDGFVIGETIDILDDEINVNTTISKALLGCAGHFERVKPDMLIVLGDRYEILGPVIAAANALIPIAHIHGGETTEGAIDEMVRHAVTKFSYLHFAGCEAYRKRIIQLGEQPDRVFNVGTLGAENILTQKYMTRHELELDLNFNIDKYGLVTFHPVTLEVDSAKIQINELMDALLEFPDMTFLITKSNADMGGNIINSILDKYGELYPNKFKVVTSLGMKRYLSAMKYSCMVIGNSSSGILEAPIMKIPTINIGDRQKGRIQTDSIINCKPVKQDIITAINEALKDDFVSKIKNQQCIYGDGNTSTKIVGEIRNAFNNGIDLKKKFYDIEFEVK